MASAKKEHIEIAERLQTKLLEYFETRLISNTLSDTGAATLARLLMSNGWSIDPSQIPEGLRSKLTQNIDPNELDDDDLGQIIAKIG